MIDARVTVNVDRVRARFGKISRTMRVELSQAVRNIADALLARIQRMLSGERLQVRSGRFLGSWGVRMESMLRARIKPDFRIRYASIHEKGGIIYPRRGEYLHFRIEDTGKWVRTKRVVIPARYYLRDSVAEIRPTVTNKVLISVRRVIS